MATPSDQAIIYMPADKLRELFNQSQYPELIQQNKLVKEIVRSRLLQESALLGKTLPPGTKSEIIIYHDPANKGLYAKVHQYILPDGTIGASGKPDPKAILLDGKMYCFKPVKD